jgi:hypothetical protein
MGRFVVGLRAVPHFRPAYYYAALGYTTLGDIQMSPSRRLLSPLAAVDGMLMFGVSTAMVFAVIQQVASFAPANLSDDYPRDGVTDRGESWVAISRMSPLPTGAGDNEATGQRAGGESEA